MDEFVKEPDQYDFVDSEHILNFLEKTMEEGCGSSVLACEESMVTSAPGEGSIDVRTDSTAGLLDNLIKTVCDGFDESTLIDKDNSIDSTTLFQDVFDRDDSVNSDTKEKACDKEVGSVISVSLEEPRNKDDSVGEISSSKDDYIGTSVIASEVTKTDDSFRTTKELGDKDDGSNSSAPAAKIDDSDRIANLITFTEAHSNLLVSLQETKGESSGERGNAKPCLTNTEVFEETKGNGIEIPLTVEGESPSNVTKRSSSEVPKSSKPSLKEKEYVEDTKDNEIDVALVNEEEKARNNRKISLAEATKLSDPFVKKKEIEDKDECVPQKISTPDVVVISDDESEEYKVDADDSDVKDHKLQPQLSETSTLSASIPEATQNKRETPEHAFHINDNMKKGLSFLAFPSQASTSRLSTKKKKPPFKPKSSTRITIGEALEKAQDAASKLVSEGDISKNHLTPQSKLMKIGSNNSEDSRMALVTIGGQPESSAIDRALSDALLSFYNFGVDSPLGDLTDTHKSSSIGSSISSGENIINLDYEDQDMNVLKMDKEEKQTGESRERGTSKSSRFKMSSKMWELLRFTFDHEHFPSSVHMARLAKMMGVTWSQIRNWFTNRRVENKKAGLYPRDKVLLYCPYCEVPLKTESVQKGHLFSSSHVKKILGSEYVGQSDFDTVKWKQRSLDINVKDRVESKSEKVESPVEDGDLNSATRNLGKRWKNSFLVSEAPEFNLVKPTKLLVLQSGGSGITPNQESKVVAEKEFPRNETGDDKSKRSLNAGGEENFRNLMCDLESKDTKEFKKCNDIIQGQSVTNSAVSDRVLNMSVISEQNSSGTPEDSSAKCNSSIRSGLDVPVTMSSGLNSTNTMPRKELRQYNNSWDEDIVGYQCPTCFKIFQTEWQMIKHTMIHLLFICDICSSMFPSEHILKLHLHDHLTGRYEEEIYYCQFSCKVCHSLKCECYEPQFYKPMEIMRNYSRPQKAVRSKKTFKTKRYSGPNDHLRVTVSAYQKYFAKGNSNEPKELLKSSPKSMSGTPLQNKNLVHIQDSMEEQEEKKPNTYENKKLRVDYARKPRESGKLLESSKRSLSDKSLQSSSPTMAAPRLSVRKDLMQIMPEDIEKQVESNITAQSEMKYNASNEKNYSKKVTSPNVVANSGKLADPPRGKGRPRKKKGQSNTNVYNCGDFYYMCEICDSNFVSKSEMQDHMFFHRFRNRSRRGEKRRLMEASSEERKKSKLVGAAVSEENETLESIDFGRFRCQKCGGHFASNTDLQRHNKQAHSEDLSSSQVLKCNYCEKLYRRERELRRHLKHACSSAPDRLRKILCSTNDNLYVLHEKGEGPHFTMVDRKTEELLRKEATHVVPKGPYKCKYCPLVTKREQEMKRHIWMTCKSTPKNIKKQCKQGYSLEELGFKSGMEECKDNYNESPKNKDILGNNDNDSSHLNNSDFNTSPQKQYTDTSQNQLMSADLVTSTQKECIAESNTSPVSQPNVDIKTTSLSPSSPESKSLPVPKSEKQTGFLKLPFVCAYCGIWYFRELSVARHMKERCIIIPQSHRECLVNGGVLCNTVSNSLTSTVLKHTQGIYKMVAISDKQGNVQPLPDLSPKLLANSQPLKPQVNEKEGAHSSLSAPIVQKGEEEVDASDKSGPAQAKKTANKKVTRCNRCHETFISMEAVLAHSSVHHGPKKGLYKCKLCFEKFQRYKQLREHVWEHTQETPYKCHMCDAKFRLSDSLVDHLQSIHAYTAISEKNLFKWLPNRFGKYRELETKQKSSNNFNTEETIEALDTTLDNLAEDMVVTDAFWTKGNASSEVQEAAKKCYKSQAVSDKTEVVASKQDAKCKIGFQKFSPDKASVNARDSDNEQRNKKSEKIKIKSTIETRQTRQKKKKDSESPDVKSEKGNEKTGKKKIDDKYQKFKATKNTSPGKTKEQKNNSGDDDEELLTGNLESIIETVNLTDDNFLE
ncbi:hypothetical protein SK128_025266 [Halocaridina rubra]|uniref:Uncharacterized protein n=1 Tax=Halocaridina rubra TaxID=373956 RepID=A0AAN8WQ27_HALRR